MNELLFFFIQLINKWLPKNCRKRLHNIIAIKWGESTHFPGRTGNRGENVDKYLTKRNIYVWSFSHSISWQDFFCAVSKVFDKSENRSPMVRKKKKYIYKGPSRATVPQLANHYATDAVAWSWIIQWGVYINRYIKSDHRIVM